MRYQLIDTHKKTWPINLMCQVLNVSTSSYYAWYRRPESPRSQSNRVLDEQIAEHKQRYGVPPITGELKDQGFHYSESRVARRMKKLGLKGVQAKRFKRTTDSNHGKPMAPDLINQDFTAEAPNQKWVSDLTYTNPNKFSYIPSPAGEGWDEENLNINLLGLVLYLDGRRFALSGGHHGCVFTRHHWLVNGKTNDPAADV